MGTILLVVVEVRTNYPHRERRECLLIFVLRISSSVGLAISSCFISFPRPPCPPCQALIVCFSLPVLKQKPDGAIPNRALGK